MPPGPGRCSQGALEGERQIDLDLLHGGVLAISDRHEVIPTSPADASSDVEECNPWNHEVAGVAPTAVNNQMRQAIGAAHSLAVKLKARFGLVGLGCCCPLLETRVFSTGGESSDRCRPGGRSEAE